MSKAKIHKKGAQRVGISSVTQKLPSLVAHLLPSVHGGCVSYSSGMVNSTCLRSVVAVPLAYPKA